HDRAFYDDCATEFNSYTAQLPHAWLASLCGFREAPLFQAAPGELRPPRFRVVGPKGAGDPVGRPGSPCRPFLGEHGDDCHSPRSFVYSSDGWSHIRPGGCPGRGETSGGGTVLMEERRILLVDDNEVNRVVASRLLQRLGFTVDSVADGLAALE